MCVCVCWVFVILIARHLCMFVSATFFLFSFSTSALVHSFAVRWLKEHTTDFICISEIHATDEMDNDEIISCFGRFHVFFPSTLCFIMQAVLLCDWVYVCVCVLFVYFPFFLLLEMNGPGLNQPRKTSEKEWIERERRRRRRKKITCTQRINNRAEATTLKTFKSAKRILFPI